MKNNSLLSRIKKVGLISFLALSAQGCALLHMDGAGFEDMDDLNASNPYNNQRSPSAASRDGNYEQRDENDRQSRLLSAISHQDIVLGMDQSQVMAAWGSPRDVETAGNSGSGAERWLYYSGNSLAYGMNRPRIVYFENGHVVGWESAHR
jgi:hypothetical protein